MRPSRRSKPGRGHQAVYDDVRQQKGGVTTGEEIDDCYKRGAS